jgi:protein arginine kinase activator
MLAKQLKMEKIAEELAASDKKACPVCGITFADFRKGGRLGCSYDYVAFEEDLEPLLVNIHGALAHTGKTPSNLAGSPERRYRLNQLKNEMKDAIAKEDYETAGKLRDRISSIENGEDTTWQEDSLRAAETGRDEVDEDHSDGDDDFQSNSPIV